MKLYESLERLRHEARGYKVHAVVWELAKYPDEIESLVCVTAQHRSMLDQVLHLFDVTPDYDLNLMKDNQSLGEIFSNSVKEVGKIIEEIRPDWVLVQGDTVTTLAAAIAAYFNGAKVGHIEAGLRTGNKMSPFPEEMNRRLTSPLADMNFPPTARAKEMLLTENIPANTIFTTGNTVVDALNGISKKIEADTGLSARLDKEFSFLGKDKRLILVTGHRRESFGRGFEDICRALKEIAEKFDDAVVLYAVHLNPNVRGPVGKILGDVVSHSKGEAEELEAGRVALIEPLDYLSFVYLLKRSFLVLTDSGGIQEEAPSLAKPVLVMRENTERPEAVSAGTVRLVGTDRERIVNEVTRLMTQSKAYGEMANVKSLLNLNFSEFST